MTFRKRGVRIAVDSTEAFELDVLYHQVPDRVVSRISSELGDLPLSGHDVPHGPVLRREFEAFYVYFLPVVDSNGDPAILTVAIRPIEATNPLTVSQIVELIAKLRGVLGI